MLARKTSESESDFEILQECLSPNTLEELEESLDASSPTVQEYSLTVEFKKVVCEKIRAIGEKGEQIKQLWHDVAADKKVKKEGSDGENRPLFVSLQAIIESTITSFLEKKRIECSIGVIHTPTPATPLRVNPAPKVEEGLVKEEIANDPKCLQTVTDRAIIIREYLNEEGELFSVYETDVDNQGNKITGMDIFYHYEAEYENLHGIKLKTFEQKFTGATYVFGNREGDSLVFSLKAYQANQELSDKKWCIWFGSIDLSKTKTRPEAIDKTDKVARRLTKINNFLQENAKINIVQEYKQKVSTSLEQVQVVEPFKEGGLDIA
ncbi:hypothetical protein [Candidatus Mesenet endosymbiont of Agriotes lineatus]|uniref:hypothetical protein n=1 Tax=Candidatus Mesenet endosymbiont of Agriotes lineatus TaxID=3077948 RepID=UPI0030D23789